MKRFRNKYLHLCLVFAQRMLFVSLLILVTPKSWSDDSGLVEYISEAPAEEVYKYRRNDSGYLFKLTSTEITNSLYISDIDDDFYENIFKHSFSLYEGRVGYKINFSFGSMTIEAGLGYGSINSDSTTAERSLSVSKYNIGSTIMFDMLFNEPLIVPFIYLELYKTEYEESIKSTTARTTKTYETPQNYSYSLGAMLQLNKLEKLLGIDEELSERAYKNYGLQNTFLSFAMTDINADLNGNEPLGTDDYLYTIGLGLEF